MNSKSFLSNTGLWCFLTILLALAFFPPVTRAGEADLRDEKSVNPGINDNYLAPDVDAGQWVERLEREGREVYDQRERIVQAAGIRPGSAVADVGSGTGLFTLMFAKAVGPEGEVYAVDIVPTFLEHIAERVKEAGVTNVKTNLCTEKSVELPPNSVDTVFICDTYHHFEYPKNTLASIHRALRPGGQIVLVDFKRVPGESSDWILNHVRAGEEVVTSEIEAAGFHKIEEDDFLKENYLLKFRKVEE